MTAHKNLEGSPIEILGVVTILAILGSWGR